MNGAVLVLNAGSSSIKFAVYQAQTCPEPGRRGGRPARLLRGQVAGIGLQPHSQAHDAEGHSLPGPRLEPGADGGTDHRQALTGILDWVEQRLAGAPLAAAGHRVVHGGERFAAPTLIDPATLAALETLVPLAPLHQPRNLAAIRTLAAMRPNLPQVACFDTAFHRGQPPVAQAFALPRAMTEAGIKRYGFHGLSYEYVARALPDLLGQAARGRVVVAHLGAGASLCALRDGASVASTMGFTALDGLVMGTRCGNLDPGVLLYLLREKGHDADSLEDLLYHHSGLLGVSGISADMEVLLQSPDPRAQEAVDLFVYRIARELGSLAAALGGLDALVFTGGIGEHAPEIRARVCRDAAWLGLSLAPAANAAGGPRISAEHSPRSAWIIPTDEESVIARQTWATIR